MLVGGLAAVVLWGLAPVATRAAVGELAPLPLLVLRISIAALALLPWAVPVFRRLTRPQAVRLAAAGILGMVGYTLPVTAGLRWLPASTTGLLLASEPIWVMLICRAFFAERLAARAWLGSVVALAGVAVLAGPAAVTGGAGFRTLAGAGLVLAGTLAFGGYTIVLRPLSDAYGALRATAASTVAGAIPYLAFAGTVPASRLAGLPASAWGQLAFLALGSSVAGMVLWNRAVAAFGSSRISLLLYLEPAVSVSGAAVLLGEHVTLAMAGAGLLILFGVAAAASGHPGQRVRGPQPGRPSHRSPGAGPARRAHRSRSLAAGRWRVARGVTFKVIESLRPADGTMAGAGQPGMAVEPGRGASTGRATLS